MKFVQSEFARQTLRVNIKLAQLLRKSLYYLRKRWLMHDRCVEPNSNIRALDTGTHHWKHADPIFVVFEFLLLNQRLKKITRSNDSYCKHFWSYHTCKCEPKTYKRNGKNSTFANVNWKITLLMNRMVHLQMWEEKYNLVKCSGAFISVNKNSLSLKL